MKKKLAALALSSTLLVGVVTGCAASKSEDKEKSTTKQEKTLAEKRGVTVWAKRGNNEVHYEAKDIKDYYRGGKSGVLVLTLKSGKEITVTDYHLEEEHPNAD